MTVYDLLCERCSDLYWDETALAMAVKEITASVCSEWEDFKTLDIADDEAVTAYIACVADGKGYTFEEIIGR